MESNFLGLGILLDYQDRASAKMLKTSQVFNQTRASAEELVNTVDANMERLNRSAMLGAGLATAGFMVKKAGIGILGTLNEARLASAELETEFARLKFISGAVGEEWESLRKFAIQTGMDTPFSPVEATQAMIELRTAGLSTEAVLESLHSVLDLVALSAGSIDLASGASLIASTLNKFNLEATESARVADIFAKATQDTAFQMAELSSFINSLGAAPSKLDRPLEELMALGGLLRNIGQQAPQAGATVAGFGRKLLQLTGQMSRENFSGVKKDALEVLGLSEESFWDAEGKMRSMSEIFKEIIEGTLGLSDQKATTAMQQLFGDQAGNLITAVRLSQQEFYRYDEATGQYVQTTREGKRSLDELIASFQNVGGEAKAGAEALLETSWGIAKLNEGIRQTLVIMIGQTVAPIVNKFIGMMSKALSSLIAFGEKRPWFMKALGYGVGIAGIMLVVVGTGLALAGAFIGLQVAIGKAQGALVKYAVTQGGLNASMLTGSKLIGFYIAQITPLAGKLLSLTAVSSLLYLAWKFDFMGLRTIVSDFALGVKKAFQDSEEYMKLDVSDFVETFNTLTNSGDWVDRLTGKLMELKLIWQGLSEAWSDYTLSEDTFLKLQELGLLPLIENLLFLKMNAEEFFRGFQEGFTGTGQIVITICSTVIGWIDSVVTAISNLFSPVEEVEEKLDGVNSSLSTLNLEGWERFGNLVGIVGASFLVWKIGSTVWDIASGIFGIGKAVAVALPKIWAMVSAYGSLLAVKVADKLETLALHALYAKDAIMRGIVIAKQWLQVAATTALNTVTGIWNALLAVNPITWIIVGIVALIAAIVYLWNTSEGFRNVVLGILDALGSAFRWLWDEVLVPLYEWFSEVFTIGFSTGLEVITNVFQGILDTVTSIIDNIKLILGGIIDFVAGVFTGDWERAWQGVSDIFSGIFGVLGDIVKAPINLIITALNTMIEGMNKISFDVPDWVPIMGGKTFGFDIPTIPLLETGGLVEDAGIAMLHPAEVVVNADLTKKLQSFLDTVTGAGLTARDVIQPNISIEPVVQEPRVSNDNRQSNTITNVVNNFMQAVAQPQQAPQAQSIDNSITIEQGAIQLSVTNASESDAESLAEELLEKLMEKIERKTQLKRMVNYQPIGIRG